MPAAPLRVLVLDAGQRAALAVVRSLGKIPGVSIHAADSTATALAGASKYCTRYVRHPSAYADHERFAEWLIDYVTREGIDYLQPVTEVTSRTVLGLRTRLGRCVVPFASYEQVLRISDKWQLVQLARTVAVPCPESEYVDDAAAFRATAGDQRYPLVLKPCLSRIESGGRWIDTSVHIVRSAAQLTRTIDEKEYLRHYPFMAQEFIPGHGAGVFALYDRGTAVAFFSHRRIREKPPSGGVSTLSESAELDPKLLALARALLDSAGWHGVAMVEFRIDVAGRPFLMEVNTRFWGSLQLSIDSGVDFPRLLFERHLQPDAMPSQPLVQYRVGRRLRWLLGDADNLYLTLRNGQLSVGERVASLIRFFIPHPFTTRHEVDRWDDPAPAWLEFREYLRKLL